MNEQVAYQTAHTRARSFYDSPAAAASYSGSWLKTGLMEAEQAILDRLRNEFSEPSVLDIGVGGGRTVPHFSAIAGRYVGIDYAAAMVQRCRELFPGVDFRQADATDLSEFATASFDVVWFSFNGIDHVSPEGRAHVLREACRVLRPGGRFVFSSHNLHTSPWRHPLLPSFVFSWNPWRFVRRNLGELRWHLKTAYHYLRNKPHEVQGPGYALRVDDSHGCRTMTFYISPQWQVEHLRSTGFTEMEVISMDGSRVEPDRCPPDRWIHYIARKPG